MPGSTNYFDTFIEVADDCPATAAEVPASTAGSATTVAAMQYEMIAANPYVFTQDDVLFEVFAERRGIPPEERPAAREAFFSVGQACLRASALGKRYGWGIHSDSEGRVALVPLGGEDYEQLRNSGAVTHLKAMRSKRA